MLIEHQILDRLKRIEQCLENSKQKKWLDMTDAIKYSGVSNSVLSRAISVGKLKVTKVIGKRMFKSEWIDNFLLGK